MNIWVKNCATVLGVGQMKGAPGTWGSLAALIPGYYFLEVGGPVVFYYAIAIAFVVAVWSAGEYEKFTGESDNSSIVIDELVGQWIALIPILYISPTGNYVADYAAAFILFRIFDIFKPWPIRYFDQNIKGGFGVVMDDVLAGIFAAAVLYGIVPLL